MSEYKFTELNNLKLVRISDISTDCLVVPMYSDTCKSIKENRFFTQDEINLITKQAELTNFNGKCGEHLLVNTPNNPKYKNVLIYCIGEFDKESKCGQGAFEKKGSKIYSILSSSKFQNITVLTDCEKCNHSLSICSGILQKSYTFKKHITSEKRLSGIYLPKVIVASDKNSQEDIDNINNVLESIYIVRDLVNEPANIIYPKYYAELVRNEMQKYQNISVEILGQKEMEELGMGSLLGVSLGSDKEPQLVVIKYTGNPNKKDTDIALVGKGLTFDSGGLSIKPADSMEEMKDDMAGSAVVFSSIRLLAKRKAKVNAVAALGIVENMINGKAQRPGDIVKSMSGQTIEVLNTDAEGRLVLADVLYYIKTKYNPDRIIDLATLTGAIVIALGYEYAGLFSNHDCFAKSIEEAGIKTGEKCWKLPMGKAYDKLIDSNIADVRNTSTGRGAGSITAAQFLQRFIDGHKKWAHLDIAGAGGLFKGDNDLFKAGASGFGVKLLDRYIRDNIETNSVQNNAISCNLNICQ